ncbi:hypothetical protein F7725_028528 [Dissostichus mawsoni]|uniref:NADH dehydrogenase [ubiquinone] 1 beta subcomplex subunit 4 n=1 Tax=Dissostichus mawsoni TaxID=36200 RepID=A0A7J5XG82_DISMA|nr:hypothetical protein F7725_028528 [Dissostichus mawsoni]
MSLFFSCTTRLYRRLWKSLFLCTLSRVSAPAAAARLYSSISRCAVSSSPVRLWFSVYTCGTKPIFSVSKPPLCTISVHSVWKQSSVSVMFMWKRKVRKKSSTASCFCGVEGAVFRGEAAASARSWIAFTVASKSSSPSYRRAEEERSAMRSNLKLQYQTQLNNPHRKALIEDPALNRWMYARAHTYPHFKATFKTSLTGLLFGVVPIFALYYLFKTDRDSAGEQNSRIRREQQHLPPDEADAPSPPYSLTPAFPPPSGSGPQDESFRCSRDL